ncbi:MAG: hypothetical protein GXX91_07290 [Verrucomicrobiaceae bacterium]|nr:hypothetical protein [Verrucomicrobiaceae bacterium]
MSLFSSRPKNRRCRKRGRPEKETAAHLAPGKEKPRAKKKRDDDLGAQAYRLHARIGALESFLEKKNAAEARRAEMREQNILPPPDKAARRPAKKRRLSHAERRRYHAERSRNGIHFFLLFCLACGLAWWLIFSGI